jgi:hypothetical protein
MVTHPSLTVPPTTSPWGVDATPPSFVAPIASIIGMANDDAANWRADFAAGRNGAEKFRI